MKKLLLAAKLRLFTRDTSILTICALLAALFIYTGVNKFLDYEVFKSQLGRSPFIQPMAGFIAASLPAAEIVLAILLSIPSIEKGKKRLPKFLRPFLSYLASARRLGLYVSYGLMLFFTGYIYIMLHFSPDLPCSCGGALASLGWKNHLIFNGAFTVLALSGALLASVPYTTTSKDYRLA